MKAIITATLIAATLSFPALAQDSQTVIFATGSEGNPYWNGAGELANIFRKDATIKPEVTGGAGAITDRVAKGTAQLGFIQADALIKAQEEGLMDDIRVVGPAGREYAIIVCGQRSRITESDDLQSADKPKLIVGSDQSGFNITLDKWVTEDSYFANPVRVYESTDPDDGAVADLIDNTAQCIGLNSALSGGVLKKLNDASAGRIHMIDIDDWDLDDAQVPTASDGSGGGDLYAYEDISSKQFPGLISSGSITTVSQPVVMIANDAWASKNPDLYRRLRGVLTRNPNFVK